MSTDTPAGRRIRREREPGDLFILGLVGRAGSGKSSVAAALAEDGANVLSADAIGHEVTDRDPAVRRALIQEYGEDVYQEDGTLDRAKVAARVFSDPSARRRLDQLTHPRIVQRIGEAVERWRADGFRGVVVVDAALMLDWGLERACDAVIAVTAPEEQQAARLVAARGWTEEQARARLAVQRKNEAFAAAADATIDNRGSLDDLARAVRAALARLRSERA